MNYIRISASYLFNIEVDGKFLLIKSERRNQYQPVGGCYKYFPEAEVFLNSIGAIPEKKSNGVDSLMDLRLMIPEESLEAFVMWYYSMQGREVSFDRELNEELISFVPQNKQHLFDEVQTKNLAQGTFDLFFDEEKGMNSIKPMDIVGLELSKPQKDILKSVCANNSEKFIFASENDILKGYKLLNDGTKVKIGSHTKNILVPSGSALER